MVPQKIKRLKDLIVERLGFVPRGANPGAHKLVAKALYQRKEEHPSEPPSFAESQGEADMLARFWGRWWTLRDTLESVVREISECELPLAEKQTRFAESVQQFADAVAALVVKSEIDLVVLDATLAGYVEDAIAKSVITKSDLGATLDQYERDSAAPERPTTKARREPADVPAPPAEEKRMDPKEILAKLSKGEALTTAEVEVLTKALAPEPVAKELPEVEAVRKAAETERVKLEKRIADLETSAKVERIAKAADGLKLAGDVALITKALTAVDHDDGAREALTQVLAGAANVAKAAHVLRVARGHSAEMDPASPIAKRDALVAKLRSENPAVSVGEAMIAVYKAHPDVKAAVRAAERARVG